MRGRGSAYKLIFCSNCFIFHCFRVYSYGEKGAAVIESTIYRFFNPISTRSNAIDPLKFTDYTRYVLMPYVAHRLIAQDLTCTLKEAYATMLKSGDLGSEIHPLLDGEDPELEDIMEENTRLACKAQGKVRFLNVVFITHY
jgi:hypothetical protein